MRANQIRKSFKPSLDTEIARHERDSFGCEDDFKEQIQFECFRGSARGKLTVFVRPSFHRCTSNPTSTSSPSKRSFNLYLQNTEKGLRCCRCYSTYQRCTDTVQCAYQQTALLHQTNLTKSRNDRCWLCLYQSERFILIEAYSSAKSVSDRCRSKVNIRTVDYVYRIIPLLWPHPHPHPHPTHIIVTSHNEIPI